MSFSGSSYEQRVDGGRMFAKCQNGEGEYVDSELNLDDYLGNDNGNFSWGSTGFSGSAELVRFESGVLVALLQNGNGDLVEAKIDLDQYIGNDNGNLTVVQ